MRGFKLYKIDNFDYDGEVDMDFFDANYQKDIMFCNIYGDNALCSLNRDLERMGRKYMSCKDKGSAFARELAAQIRAKTIIISDIIG